MNFCAPRSLDSQGIVAVLDAVDAADEFGDVLLAPFPNLSTISSMLMRIESVCISAIPFATASPAPRTPSAVHATHDVDRNVNSSRANRLDQCQARTFEGGHEAGDVCTMGMQPARDSAMSQAIVSQKTAHPVASHCNLSQRGSRACQPMVACIMCIGANS